MWKRTCWVLLSASCAVVVWSLQHQQPTNNVNRRQLLSWSAATTTSSLLVGTTAAAAAATATILQPSPALAQDVGGLASRLRQRDPSLLKNSVFNIPPSVQVYPPFMRGRWNVTAKFGGYLFPSTKIPRSQLMAKDDIPGFLKCSIVTTSDVGKEGDVSYPMVIDPTTGWEDRAVTLSNQVNAYLGYDAVQEVLYDPRTNPNRISVDFVNYKTINAERIELFCNARESALLDDPTDDSQVFVASEHVRQVTFGTGSTVGVARQAVTNYAHYWTWRSKKNEPPNQPSLTGNLLTAAYLDPQDPLFFQEPAKPVAVYSHILTAQRITI